METGNMKVKPISGTESRQDRLATWEEVCRATVATPGRIMELYQTGQTDGGLCEIDSESGGRVRFPVEEFQFFSYLSDIENSEAPN